MALTKVSGGILDPGINVAGIVTATGFDGPFTGGSSKNITAGIITATGFDLNGNGDISGNLVIGGNLTANGDFTTLNTTLREVEILRVDANTTATAGIITQRGSGDILNLYDGTTEVFSVSDGGNLTLGGGKIYGDDNAFNVLTLQSTSGNNNHSRIDISVNESDNGGIHFYTAGSSVAERRITIKGTSGNVGIGTNDPNTELEIQSATDPKIRLQSQESGNKRLDLWIDGGEAIGYIAADQSASQLAFKTAGSERLRIHADGEVDVKGGAAGQNALLVTGNYSSSNNVDIQTWQRIGGAVQAKMIYKDASTDLHFGTDTAHNFSIMTAGTDRIKIANNSAATSIGGAMTFNAMLTVQGDISGELFRLKATENTTRLMVSGLDTSDCEVNLYDKNGGQRGILVGGETEFAIKAPNNSAPLTFYTNNGSSIGERLRIKSDGKVLITNTLGLGGATSNPSELLHAQTSSGEGKIVLMGATTGTLAISGLNGASRVLFGDSSTENAGNITYTHSSDTLSFRINGNTRWKFDSSGHFLPDSVGSYDIGSTGAEIGDVYIADNKKVFLGSDQDFTLHHNNAHAIIKNTTGRIYLLGDDIWFKNQADDESLARFMNGGEVFLYNNDNLRLTTTSTGITVGGEVAASQDYPDLKPTLDLNFVATAKLDPRVTFNRLGCGSYYGRDGLVKFGTTNEPRFDHDPVTRECKGLLIEEQRQNMFPYTTRPGDSGWTSSKSGTFVQNTTETAAPDGTFTATKWTFTNTDPYLYDVQNLSANTSYTLSMWVKAGTNMAGDRLTMRIGAAPYSSGTAEVIPADGTWKRVSYTKTVGGSAESSAGIGFEPQTSPSGNPASGDVIYIWGPQLEEGEFLSSYIPSNSSHRPLRGADKCYIDGQDFDDFYNQPEGTIVSSHSLLENVSTTSNCYTYQVAPDSGTSEAPFRLIDRNSSYGNTLVATSVNSNSSVCFFKASGDPATVANVKMKVAFAIKKDDFAASFNGGATLTDTSGNVSETNDHLAIGYYKPSPQAYLNGHIQRLAYYPKRLPNNQLRNLSS